MHPILRFLAGLCLLSHAVAQTPSLTSRAGQLSTEASTVFYTTFDRRYQSIDATNLEPVPGIQSLAFRRDG